MSKSKETKNKTSVFKKTSQGGRTPKTSSMSKHQKRNFKFYRGQGK